MSENPNASDGSNQRIGRSRFVVPHSSFDWYVRGMALSALACGAFVGFASWFYHQQLFAALGLSNQAGWPELVGQYSRLSFMAAGIVTVMSALFITLMSMFLFHRIVGPVYRMKLHMQSILNGEEVTAMRFRSTDQLSDVNELYNQLLVSLDVIPPEKPEETAPVVDVGDAA